MLQKLAPFMHSARNLRVIANAAKLHDCEQAINAVMDANNITDDTQFAVDMCFAGFAWDTATRAERERKLCMWLRHEQIGGER